MARGVLLVDDDPRSRALAGRLLRAAGLHVAGEARDGAAALATVGFVAKTALASSDLRGHLAG